MSYIERGQRRYIEATAALFAGAFVTFTVLYTTQPIMPELSRQFGITPATSSLSLSFATLGLAVSMLWVSGISDAWGRKRMMTVSLILCSLLSILLSFAPDFRTLLILRAVQGVALAGSRPLRWRTLTKSSIGCIQVRRWGYTSVGRPLAEWLVG